MDGNIVLWKGPLYQKEEKAREHKSPSVEEKKEALHLYFQNNFYNLVQEMPNVLADQSDVPETGVGNTGMGGSDMVSD